ncbi:hypothetical protein IAR55_005650 [Kwoniella newhampshirensis]|uniref:Uncharacterized protein n=1 Tax=Kwoniella newhampshirensis TaxID=1651941 RepID=A0AAW0YGZ5_9TREE
MPQIPFLRSDKDKSQSQAPPSPSPPPPPPLNPTPSTSSIDSPQQTSKYHPSRLLRRKPSVSAKTAEAQAQSQSRSQNEIEYPASAPATGSSTASFFEHQQHPLPPTSPRSTNGNAVEERDKFFTYPRRESDSRRPKPTATGEQHSSSASKRSAWVYDRRLTEGDEAVVIIPSGEGREGEVLTGFAGLGMGGKGSSSSSSSGGMKVLDGGIGGSSGLGVFGRSVEDQGYTLYRPPTPPDSAVGSSRASQIYPTALSPPRRPMPRSPKAVSSPDQHQLATSSQDRDRPMTPPSTSMLQTLSAVGGDGSDRRRPSPASGSSGGGDASSPSPSPAPDVDSVETGSALARRPSVTAEWLKRKPSGSGNRLRRKSSFSSLNPSAATVISTISPPLPDTPTRSVRKSLDESPRIRSAMTPTRIRQRTSSFSSTNSDTDPPSSDGEIGLNPTRRRSLLGHASPSRSSSNGRSGDRYEVCVLCVDNRSDKDELEWKVVIRKRASRSSLIQGMTGGPSSPLPLSTESSTAQAPSSASSINLSLALDQPTGKLVFISFPMDIHATPTRARKTQVSSPRTNSSLRPSTPPPPPSQTDGTFVTGSPITPSSSRRKAPPAWPSPKSGYNRSPPSSPKDMFTPRKSRVGGSQLGGALFDKVTNGEQATEE